MSSIYGSNDPLVVAAQDLLSGATGMVVRREGDKLTVTFDEPVVVKRGQAVRFWAVPVPAVDKRTRL